MLRVEDSCIVNFLNLAKEVSTEQGGKEFVLSMRTADKEDKYIEPKSEATCSDLLGEAKEEYIIDEYIDNQGMTYRD